jgi:hypothetical protein
VSVIVAGLETGPEGVRACVSVKAFPSRRWVKILTAPFVMADGFFATMACMVITSLERSSKVPACPTNGPQTARS